MNTILTTLAAPVLILIVLALIITAQRRYIRNLKADLARTHAAVIIQRKQKNEHASELKQIIMDNRMKRISEGKRIPTPEDLDWIKRHAPTPPASRIVKDDDSLARRRREESRSEDGSIHAAAYAAVYSTPSDTYDSGDSCSSPSSSPGGSCD